MIAEPIVYNAAYWRARRKEVREEIADLKAEIAELKKSLKSEPLGRPPQDVRDLSDAEHVLRKAKHYYAGIRNIT